MKKILISFFLLISLLCGCTGRETDTEQIKIYEGFREALMNNGGLVSNNIPFNYQVKVEEINGVYHYTVSVDKPQVYMGSVKLLVLNPNDISTDYVSSSKGIFDEQTIYMIPNQNDPEKGVMNEIELSGVSEVDDFQLYCLISYEDYDQLNEYRMFFSFDVIDGLDSREEIADE